MNSKDIAQLDTQRDSAEGEVASELRAGQLVGPYVLIGLLGRGGLGEVWLAKRVQGDFTPEVALKLILGHNLGDQELAGRFERERRILAQLEHPDIARLLDAGRFGPGWPYLVMERVHGLPLNEAVASMDLPQRLRLMMRICRAVQYAHRRLVIHRDLKPANILVSASGDPKLLDFNTAKLIEADDDPQLTQARTPLTPHYASPEQIRGDALGTASDIYSLGVILYELIADRSPYGRSHASFYQLSRSICDDDPAPPSEAGGGDGNLDAIVAKAMDKDPDRRYPSADALADDLAAWLDRRPVSARPMSRWQRFGLLLRRHPAPSAIIGGMALLVLSATTLFFWQLQQARAERDVALAVTGFLENLFEAADPGSTEFSGEDLFTILDERARVLLENPPEDRRIAARLLASLGTVQANFGRAESAANLFQASFSAIPDLEILVRWANANLELGDVQGAAARFEQAHAQRQAMSPEMQAFHGASYAQLQVLRGDIETALTLAREAAAVAPAASVDEVFALDTLAQVLIYAEAFAEAEQVGRRALGAAIAYYGEPHLQVATSRNNLAFSLTRLGQEEAALALLEQAAADFQQLLGVDDPRLATVWNNLANRRSEQGKLDAALSAHENALRLTRLHHGDEHPWIGLILGSRALTLQRLGRISEADALFQEAIEVLADAPEHRGRVGLGYVANQVLLGRLDAARLSLAQTRSDIEASHPADHPRATQLLEAAALVALASDQLGEAESLLRALESRSGGDPETLRLLKVQAAARNGDCERADSLWNDRDPRSEVKLAAFFKAASTALSQRCPQQRADGR